MVGANVSPLFFGLKSCLLASKGFLEAASSCKLILRRQLEIGL